MLVNNVVRNAIRSVISGPFGRGQLSPPGAILHFDADAGLTEQTGNAPFASRVLGNQYQLGADGSYSNIGANMPVDAIGGKKWLRSCGAVTNLLTNSVFAGAVSGTPGTAPTGWTTAVAVGDLLYQTTSSIAFTCSSSRYYLYKSVAVSASTVYTFSASVVVSLSSGNTLRNILGYDSASLPVGTTVSAYLDGVAVSIDATVPNGYHDMSIVFSVSTTSGALSLRLGCGCNVIACTGSVTISNPQLTATAYPQPYVPTTTSGPVTQPATNATATNGAWWSIPTSSPVYQRLSGGAMTLSTLVRMGVGSGDLALSTAYNIDACDDAATSLLRMYKDSGGATYFQLYDGINTAQVPCTWSRGDVIQVVGEVLTGATQMKVGFRNVTLGQSAITWGTAVAYDGSMNPDSTLQREMLGYGNVLPFGLNKKTLWPYQATDSEILQAVA